MLPLSTAVLLWLLTLTVGVPAQQPSAADQLSQLLGPVVEAAVARALSSWQPAALSDLSRLQARLEAVERELTSVRAASRVTCGTCQQQQTPADVCQPRGSQTETETETEAETETNTGAGSKSHRGLNSTLSSRLQLEQECEAASSPLPEEAAPHQDPAVRACARSCLQLRDQGGSPQDGVYWFTGMPVPVLCDFSHDGGGWTLLLTAATGDGWDALSVLERNEMSPSLINNYAILRHADTIRDLGSGGRFAYRIEGQAQTGRRRWGGVWFAPRSYSFVHETNSQTDVSVVRKFDVWSYKNGGFEKRMPWLNVGDGNAVLTTSVNPADWWYGTLVTQGTYTGFQHSPWITPEALQSGKVLYWIREEAF